jgi:hypothetical protein
MPRSLFLYVAMLLCSMILVCSAVGGVRDPLVHWALDGDGADSIGNNDLSIEGGDFETGKHGQALSLDGSGAHAVDEDGADYINGLDAITIAMWVKSNQIGTDKGFMMGIDPEGSDRYLSFRYDAAGSLGGGSSIIKCGVNTGQGKTTYESANDTQITEWQHVAMVWSSGEQIKLYIDGEEDQSTANEAALAGELSDFTKIIIGKGAKDTSGSWDGLIDDVYIYPEALSAGEIAEVMTGKALSVDAGGKLVTLWGKLKQAEQ